MSKVHLTLDNKHTVGLRDDGDRVVLTVDGRETGDIDFFHLSDGSGPAQLVVDGGLYDEPLAKLLIPIEPTGKPILIVNKNATVLADTTPGTIHHSGDYVFEGEPED